MFSIKTKVNGNEVPVSQFGDALAEAVREEGRGKRFSSRLSPPTD